MSAETAEQLKPYLRAVMEYGTGINAQVPGYDIGGKTGTAEKLPREAENYVLSFIGCAPLENPEVVVYVVIDEPNVARQETSQYVLELSQKIMAQAFPYLDITMKEDDVPEEAKEEQQPEDNAGQEEYTSYNENYEDTYSNPDGAYIDEDYNPDLDGWAEEMPVEYQVPYPEEDTP